MLGDNRNLMVPFLDFFAVEEALADRAQNSRTFTNFTTKAREAY